MEPPTSRPLRRATEADASAIADIWLAAFRATYAFPPAHTDAEVRAWVRDDLVPRTETWVAEERGEPVAFLSLGEGWIEQLYVRPDRTRRGIGSRLIRLAQERARGELQLWTFAVNTGARRFYERHGFVAVEETDGSGTEERQPDVRYAWRNDPR